METPIAFGRRLWISDDVPTTRNGADTNVVPLNAISTVHVPGTFGSRSNDPHDQRLRSTAVLL